MLFRKISGLIELFRLELSLAAGICVTAGQVLALGGLPPFEIVLLGFACVFCLSASALIFNDYFDYAVDQINAPQRPLPSGRVTHGECRALGAVVTLAGLTCAAALGVTAFLVAIVLWVIGFLYNARFKQTGLPGNLMVCVSVAATFVFGAVSVGQPWSGVVWIFALMAFFIDLGEEIAGDAMDMEGDKQIGSRSLALLKGRSFALRVTVALWGVLILLSLVPALLGWLGPGYLLFIAATDGLILYFSARLLRSQDAVSGRRAMRGVYLGATLCVLGFFIGRLIG